MIQVKTKLGDQMWVNPHHVVCALPDEDGDTVIITLSDGGETIELDLVEWHFFKEVSRREFGIKFIERKNG